MPADWKTRLDDAVDAHVEQMVAVRRHLHTRPEPSNEELQTSLYLYQLFGDMGLSVRMGPEGRGVIVDGPGGDGMDGAARVALRADIDALQIHDQKQVAYRSQVPGVMHACGHDAHTACVYGAVAAMIQLHRQAALPAPFAWRALFQPAEETSTGAREFTEAGAVDGMNAIFALHVDPTRPAGVIGVRSGIFTANCDAMRMTVHGRGGHGARPHLSKDPIAAAAQLISTLYQFIPRATDSQDAVVVSIGQICGGRNPNVIPEEVELWGTLRTLDRDVRRQTVENIRKLAAGVDEITGTRTEVCFEASTPSVYNDPVLTSLVSRLADEMLGPDHLQLLPRPSMGSEDFAEYLEKVPGVMFRLGCAEQMPAPGLHTPTFDVDERCLAVGAKLLAKSAIEYASQERRSTTK